MKTDGKYGGIVDRLDIMLRQSRWRLGDRLPGERPLAEEFGVSYLTLRRAVAELIARGVLERRHGSGTYVVGDSAIRNIGVILGPPSADQAARPFVGMLLDQLKQRFREHGAQLRSYLFFGDESFRAEPSFPSLLHDARKGIVKALIVEPVLHKTELEAIHRDFLPVVIMSASDYRLHAVYIDFESLARDGVAALAASGCRRIAYLDPYAPAVRRTAGASDALLSDGNRGFRQGLRAAGLSADAPVFPLSESTVGDVHAALRQSDCDGLVIGDDVWGKWVLDLLLLDGKPPGRDFRVAILANRGAATLRPYDSRVIKLVIDPAEIAIALLALATEAAATSHNRTCLRKAVKASVVFPATTEQ